MTDCGSPGSSLNRTSPRRWTTTCSCGMSRRCSLRGSPMMRAVRSNWSAGTHLEVANSRAAKPEVRPAVADRTRLATSGLRARPLRRGRGVALLGDVLPPRRIVRVQQLVALVAAGAVGQELAVERRNGRVLVRLADRVGAVLGVDRLGPRRRGLSGVVGIGWPPPPRQPPGQAMNSMKWHWLNFPPALMSSITFLALAVPCATPTFSVAPFSQSQSANRWLDQLRAPGPPRVIGISSIARRLRSRARARCRRGRRGSPPSCPSPVR